MRHENEPLFDLYIEFEGEGSARLYASRVGPWSVADINREIEWLRGYQWLRGYHGYHHSSIHINVRLAT